MRTTSRAAALTTTAAGGLMAAVLLTGCGSSTDAPSGGQTVPPSIGPTASAATRASGSSTHSSAPQQTPQTQQTRPSAPASTPGSEQSDDNGGGAPYRLTLSSLSISAKVISISADNGTLEPPTSIREVGWWQEGAKPGASTGTAVLVGHSAHRGGGVFDHLDRASVGDTVDVDTGNGRVQYRVSGRKTYSKKVFGAHAEEIEGQSGPGRLTLISCEDWNGHDWESNVVVFAKRV